MKKHSIIRSLTSSFLLLLVSLSVVASVVQADNHGSSETMKNEGWFYLGEFNHNTNQFQMSYFNVTNYPEVGERLIANVAVNQRAEKPTQTGLLGKKMGIILKNHTLVVTELVQGSAPGGIEDVWVKGFIDHAH